MQQRDFPQHFVRKLDLPLNFRQLPVWLRDLPSSFRASAGPSVIFHKHSVRLWDLLSTCVNFSCCCGTYRQLSVHPRDLSPTSRASEGPFINFSYIRGRSINFRQLFVRPRNYPTNICVSAEHCVIFSKHSMRPQGLPSTCVNFPCIRVSSVYLHQLFVRPCVRVSCYHSLRLQDLLSMFRATSGRSVYLD